MLIAIIGENCVGKSTLANKLNEKLNAKIYSGKDYLRLEKNPSMALEKFKTILKESVTGDNIIYGFTWRKENREIFKKQIDIIVQKLSPSGILVYGPASEYIFNSALELNIPIYQYDSYTMQQNKKDKLERERKKFVI